MRLAVGLLNLALGTVYTSYGLMTVVDLKRGWRSSGFSHFGVAWIWMAFTCGPHHLVHGAHVTFEGFAAGPLDLAAVLFGVPAGVTWFLLRVEAMNGGRGDRFVSGTPVVVELIPVVWATFVAGVAAAILTVSGGFLGAIPTNVAPNLVLVVLYVAIGAVLLRTQLENHRVTGGWSVSGLAVTMVFPSCAFMHGVWALYRTMGEYRSDWHLEVVDLLAIPGAVYFLWVVWGLHFGHLDDWNKGSADVTRRESAVGAEEPLRLERV